MRNVAIICSIIVGASILSFPAVSQQKTVKECQAEWRANKAANQAKGITEKAYVTQCRAGRSAAQPAPAPAASTSSKPKTTRRASEKTVKECQAEWRANKAANQAKGITERAYVAQCRAGESAAQPAPTPAVSTPPKAKTTTAPVAPPARSSARPAPAPAATALTGANQYSTEAQAKARCGSGTVVWANLNSKIFHFAGYKDYGNTKSGAYMCERDATSQGMRAAKNEKHP
jgi:hypothetical protein